MRLVPICYVELEMTDDPNTVARNELDAFMKLTSEMAYDDIVKTLALQFLREISDKLHCIEDELRQIKHNTVPPPN